MDCRQCGSEIGPGEAFCRRCGAKAAGGESAAAGPAVPVPPPPAFRRPIPATSGLAIASLILGLLSFMCLPIAGAVLAIVFGFIARGQIKRSAGSLEGKGMSTAGISLGFVNLVIIIILATISILLAIFSVDKTETVNRAVLPQGAQRLTATLDIREGKVDVGGGAGDIFEGSFTYNIKGWEPTIDYTVNDSEGSLSVAQGVRRFSWLWNTRNDWNINFNDATPLDLTAYLSSADGRFELSSLVLDNLVINASSGDVGVDISGHKPFLERVKIDASSGDVNLNMRGIYEQYVQLDIATSSGEISADLRGQWQTSLSAGMDNSSGGIRLHLPRDVGVRVRIQSSSGDISADGMKLESEDRDGSLYVNDAFGSSPVTLQIDIESSSGDVTLILGI
ncbi:MAG: hypothetical protein A2V52_05650 [Actinobacteria bacterium RBG_19FT_COMBO_54_7]|nr:MAG: hypothetical protein A2V52_05650 [Actinobacteria bacterium RBG_19FT_COMBO_54_7]